MNATGILWDVIMEGSVSNLEICNLAYTGKIEQLKKCILSDRSLAARTDQVCVGNISEIFSMMQLAK